jgi:hypothetical protein
VLGVGESSGAEGGRAVRPLRGVWEGDTEDIEGRCEEVLLRVRGGGTAESGTGKGAERCRA